MTWFEIVAVAGLLTILSLRYNNVLISLGASIFWLVLMAYNLDNPPGGITQGSAIHEWMTLGFIAMAMAIMFMWVRERNKSVSIKATMTRNRGEGEETIQAEIESEGLLGDVGAYRKRVHRALHPRNRR